MLEVFKSCHTRKPLKKHIWFFDQVMYNKNPFLYAYDEETKTYTPTVFRKHWPKIEKK